MRYKKMLKRLIRAFRPGQFKLKEVLRIIANEHLTWAFGILPLISDIESLMTIFRKHENTVRDIVTGARRTFRYGRAQLPKKLIPLPPNLGIIGQFRGVGQQVYSDYAWSTPPEWMGYYSYFIRCAPQAKTPYGSWLIMLDALGVHPTAEVLWDAIPFSFVVDWILDIGETMHETRIDWVPLTMHLIDAMHHVKFALTRRYWLVQPTGSLTYTCSETYTVFQRRRFIAEQEAKQGLKHVGVDKLLLSASLAASR
jgi:hypothetical protein